MKYKIARFYIISPERWNPQRGCYEIVLGEKERYEESVNIRGETCPVTTEIVELPDQEEGQADGQPTE